MSLIRSFLFVVSAVIKLEDYDPNDPRKLRLEIEKSSGVRNAVIEYDTEESASEWHREMSVALFNYRQRRNRALYGESKGGPSRESSGVRICVPLHRIESDDVQEFAGVGLIVTLRINDDPTLYDLNNTSGSSLDAAATSLGSDPPPKAPNVRELRFLVFKHERTPDVPDAITLAKERRQRHSGEPPLEADTVTVDFGPYASTYPSRNLPDVAD